MGERFILNFVAKQLIGLNHLGTFCLLLFAFCVYKQFAFYNDSIYNNGRMGEVKYVKRYKTNQ